MKFLTNKKINVCLILSIIILIAVLMFKYNKKETFTQDTTQDTNYLYLVQTGDNTYDVKYNSDTAIAGFQFNVNGSLTGASESEGAAAAAGFSVSASNGIVIGFSFTGATIPEEDEGTLVVLEGNEINKISGIVVSGAGANNLGFVFRDTTTTTESPPTDPPINVLIQDILNSDTPEVSHIVRLAQLVV